MIYSGCIIVIYSRGHILYSRCVIVMILIVNVNLISLCYILVIYLPYSCCYIDIVVLHYSWFKKINYCPYCSNLILRTYIILFYCKSYDCVILVVVHYSHMVILVVIVHIIVIVCYNNLIIDILYC